MHLTPDEVTFCILAFEGPDRYSRAGGLGVRVTHLAETLASQGYETRLLFIGDPAKPGFESRCEGRLILHRHGGIVAHPLFGALAEKDPCWGRKQRDRACH